MKVGERIRLQRKKIGMSADQLADIIGTSRSTIFRYENGAIEKMPTSALEPIAEALRTTPAYLMGWENTEDNERFALSIDADNIIVELEKLNELGRKEAIKRVEELTHIKKYSAKSKINHLTPIAAHNDNADDEDQQNLMKKDIDEL